MQVAPAIGPGELIVARRGHHLHYVNEAGLAGFHHHPEVHPAWTELVESGILSRHVGVVTTKIEEAPLRRQLCIFRAQREAEDGDSAGLWQAFDDWAEIGVTEGGTRPCVGVHPFQAGLEGTPEHRSGT